MKKQNNPSIYQTVTVERVYNTSSNTHIIDKIALLCTNIQHNNIDTLLKDANDLAAINDEFADQEQIVIYRSAQPILGFIKMDSYTSRGEMCIVIDYVKNKTFVNDLSKCDFTDVIEDYLITDQERKQFKRLSDPDNYDDE
jgi:hypothetical protein